MKTLPVARKARDMRARRGGVVGMALLAGCATGPKLDYTDYAGEPVKSFYMNIRRLDGGVERPARGLVGMNKAYLLSVTGYCPDLQFANAIAVTSTANTVDRFEKVIVGSERCFIQQIRPLDTKQMKEDRKLLREQMKKPAEAPPSRPDRRFRLVLVVEKPPVP